MSAQEKTSINLIPQKGMESSTTGRVLAWILSSFRIIVIATEMIVMIAFLSRFWLDAQNSDLSEEIDQKVTLLQASADFENIFKETQNKLAILQSLYSSTKPSEIVKNLTITLPSDVLIQAISFSNDATKIAGFSSNEISVQQYAINLANKNIFNSVSIDEISTDTENSGLLKFIISTNSSKEVEKTNSKK
jgi:Tfp pilus assembly protein PilN